MNNYLKAIEMDKILHLLAECATLEDAKNICIELKPAKSFDETKNLLAMTETALELAHKNGAPKFNGAKSLEQILVRADKGGALNIKELLDVKFTISVVGGLVKYGEMANRIPAVNAEEQDLPPKTLAEIFSRLIAQKELEKSLDDAILSQDELKDNASVELGEVRRKILIKNEQARERLQSLISNSKNRTYLQEVAVTKRNNRFVVPVKAEHKDKIKGIVHDTSASGGTLFVEPAEVANINNQIRELEGKEKAEIERILSELSSKVADKSGEIKCSYKAVVELDLAFAKADLAIKMCAFKPKLNNARIARLNAAKHPLIDSVKVVPIDIEIGGEHEGIIITGPNTGGKTVAVKTLALMCAMVKYGLFIPCREDSEVAWFDDILASISEKQSIELSLSSFSAQVNNIAEILQSANAQSLVILDEPGSGTDPGEGAALAIAILENLLQKRAKVAITSHYAELKAYAMLHENILTYGAEFDVDTLAPTYKLIKGVPSGSNAFLIARRLGISKEIIESAKKNLGGTDRKVHNILSKITKKSAEIEKMYENISEDARRSGEDKSTAAKELERAENFAKKLIDEAKIKAQNLIDKTRVESEEILKALKKAEAEKSLEKARVSYKAKMKAIEQEVGGAKSAEEAVYKLPRELHEGDSVRLFDIDKKGTVISIKNDKVKVQVGLMQFDTKLSNLRLIEEAATFNGEKIKSYTSTKVERNAAMSVDVRGMYANDAIDEIDKYIDSAVLSGFDSVTIVHGKGGGVLRKAIGEWLRNNRQVKSHRVGKYGEGEEGVTIVELK